MQVEFEISVIGELKFFLGIQINQCEDGVYVRQSKYAKELLKKFKLEDWKLMSTPMHPNYNMSKKESSSKVDQKLYRWYFLTLFNSFPVRYVIQCIHVCKISVRS